MSDIRRIRAKTAHFPPANTRRRDWRDIAQSLFLNNQVPNFQNQRAVCLSPTPEYGTPASAASDTRLIEQPGLLFSPLPPIASPDRQNSIFLLPIQSHPSRPEYASASLSNHPKRPNKLRANQAPYLWRISC